VSSVSLSDLSTRLRTRRYNSRGRSTKKMMKALGERGRPTSLRTQMSRKSVNSSDSVNISTQVQPHEHLSRLQHRHCNPSPTWTRSYTDDFHLNSFFVLLRQAGSFLLSIIISRVSEPQCAHVYMRVVLDHPRWGVHLLVVLMGLTTTPCIVVASVIAYRMYKQPLPQSRVPS